jgi:hypothetical protein
MCPCWSGGQCINVITEQTYRLAVIFAGQQVNMPPTQADRTSKKAPKAKAKSSEASLEVGFGDYHDED